MMTRTILAAGIAVCAAIGAVHADEVHIAPCRVGEVPYRECSPGVIASTDEADVCGMVDGKTYSQRHRKTPAGLKALIRKWYGQEDNHGDAEIDHILPLSLGGEDSVYNLFWEPGDGQGYTWTYHLKDRLEVELWRRVCREHTMPLADAQAVFLAPDWRPYYCQYVGGDVCGTKPTEGKP